VVYYSSPRQSLKLFIEIVAYYSPLHTQVVSFELSKVCCCRTQNVRLQCHKQAPLNPALSQIHFRPGQSRVRVTLRLTVSQSVSIGVEPLLGLMTRFLVLYLDYCGLCSLRAPSLTRGLVCHLSEVFVMSLRIFILVLYTL
jgi:hypothetical protein